MDDTNSTSDLDAWDMIAKCSKEILNLKTRLREKESENSDLRTRMQQIERGTQVRIDEARSLLDKQLHDKETEISDLRTKLERTEGELRQMQETLEGCKVQLLEKLKLEEYKVLANEQLEENQAEMLKARAQLEDARGRQMVVDQQLRDKETENWELRVKLNELEAKLRAQDGEKLNVCEPKSLKRERSPSIELIEKHANIEPKAKSQQKRKPLDNVEMVDLSNTSCERKQSSALVERVVPITSNPPSVSSTSLTQSRVSCPLSKKRKIELIASEEGLSEPRQQGPLPRNSSDPSSSSVGCHGTPPAQGPSDPLHSETNRQSASLEIPSTAPVQNVEQFIPELTDPLAAHGTKSKQLAKQAQPQPFLNVTPSMQPSSNLPPSATPIPSTPSEPLPQAKSSSNNIKKSNIKMPKVEENWTGLPDVDVKKYLAVCKPLAVTRPLTQEVSRKFLRESYGGSDMTFLQKFHVNPSGDRTRRAVYPRLDLNPHIPCRPGEPGLIFASRHEILQNPPWTLFVKLRNQTPAVWLYLGEYRCSLSGKMTAEQFRTQSPHVQTKWGQQLLNTKEFDVYVAMRARIALRKAGKIPVDDKQTEEDVVLKEINAVKYNRATLPITVEDIVEAFVRGDEGIDIISMECEEYDYVFANDMKIRMATYDPKADKEKGEKSGTKLSTTRSKKFMLNRASLSSAEGRLTSMTSSSSSGPSSAPVAEGLRRSNRPRQTKRSIIEMSDGEDQDDDQSLYESDQLDE